MKDFFVFMEASILMGINHTSLEIYIRALEPGTSGKSNNLKCLLKYG